MSRCEVCGSRSVIEEVVGGRLRSRCAYCQATDCRRQEPLRDHAAQRSQVLGEELGDPGALIGPGGAGLGE